MTDLAFELRGIRLELAAIRRDLAALAPARLSHQQRRCVELLAQLYGPAPFRSSEVLHRAAVDVTPAPELRAVLEQLGAGDVQRLGQALAHIAKRGGRAGDLRLVRVMAEAGRVLWAVEGPEGA